jgi:ABC-type phosphate transport system auxiliary subunit
MAYCASVAGRGRCAAPPCKRHARAPLATAADCAARPLRPQAANAGLQQQVRALERMLAGGEAAAVGRAQELQAQLEARDAEAAVLRRRCGALQGQLAAVQQAGSAAEVGRLQQQVAALQEELAAFDPEFFEEIEVGGCVVSGVCGGVWIVQGGVVGC